MFWLEYGKTSQIAGERKVLKSALFIVFAVQGIVCKNT